MTVAMKIDFYSYWKLNSLVVKHYLKKNVKISFFSCVIYVCPVLFVLKNDYAINKKFQNKMK